MIICVPTGSLGFYSEAPSVATSVHVLPVYTNNVHQLFVDRIPAVVHARGPPRVSSLAYNESVVRSVLVVS